MAALDKIIVTPRWKAVLDQHGLSRTQDVYDNRLGELRTQSGTSEVRRLSLGNDGTTHVLFLKKYWFDTIPKRVRPMFRGTFFGRSKVCQEYENLAWLRQQGVDAPEPVAYGEERRWGWLTRSWLISLAVPNAVGLDSYIAHELPGRSPQQQNELKKELIEKLADRTRHLHDRQFVHHDYFWRNIILEDMGLDHFYLIDAHKGYVWKGTHGASLITADLACLDAAAPAFFRRSERLRFLLRYRKQSSLHAKDKALIRRILRRAEAMRSRQIKRVQNAPRIRAKS